MPSAAHPFAMAATARIARAEKIHRRRTEPSSITCPSVANVSTYASNWGKMPLSTKLCTEVSPRMPLLVKNVL